MVAWLCCVGPVVSMRWVTGWEAERKEWVKLQDFTRGFTVTRLADFTLDTLKLLKGSTSSQQCHVRGPCL